MAPEPPHLMNVTKHCLHCNCTHVKFMYFNNGKPDQPRYKCHGCGRFFTHGGKCRKPRLARQLQTRTTTSTAVVAGAAAADHDRRTTAGPAAPRGRPRHSQRAIATPQSSGARQIQETPGSTCARTEARTAATTSTCARTDARAVAAATAGIMARPTTGALGLPRARIPIPEYREIAVESPVVSPAVGVPVPAARIPGLVQTGDDVVDVDDQLHTASRTGATVTAQGGDAVTENSNWTKAVLGVSPYGLVPASDGEKRMKVMKIKCDGKVSVVGPFWA